MIKKIFFILLSIFLIFQSVKMMNGITEETAFGRFWPAIIFSFIICLYITGIFAFAGFALPTHKLLPASYYKIKNSKQLNKYYQLLRADIFKKLLIKFFYGKPKNKNAYFDGKKSGIAHFITNTKKSEFGHLMPLILVLLITIYVALHQKWWLTTGLLFFNILGNFYPILVQRHHRARLTRMGILLNKK